MTDISISILPFFLSQAMLKWSIKACQLSRLTEQRCHLVDNSVHACKLPQKRWAHDDVIKWKHFPGFWPFMWEIHWSPVNSSHKGQWRGALMFSLICTWINGWANNREVGDLRCYRAHYDVIVMIFDLFWPLPCCDNHNCRYNGQPRDDDWSQVVHHGVCISKLDHH